MIRQLVSDKIKLVTLLCLLLGCGFAATSLIGYQSARNTLREAIQTTELPLTADNVYSEIQKDLVRPILISSMMARDTFLRDWVLNGERDVNQITRYLNEVMTHYNTVSSFFVSERSRTYYSLRGVLKTVRPDEPRDEWYFRVRDMAEPYEINVDPDLANRDKLTIFINYRVFDYQHRLIGATGVGLTVDKVNQLIDEYQRRYGRIIYLVNPAGQIALAGKAARLRGGDRPLAASVFEIDGLRDQAEAILKTSGGSFEVVSNGHAQFLNVRYIPELKLHLFVIKEEDAALSKIQQTLWLNLLLCLTITLVVLGIVYRTISRYQRRLETMATHDNLTGLANRHGLDLLLGQKAREAIRNGKALSAIMLDIDHFKSLNDRRGHMAGDRVLRAIAATLRTSLRASDIACRWGGEEFLLILPDTGLAAATQVAENLRQTVEQTSIDIDGHALSTTVSAGVTLHRHGETNDAFLARADALLYRAKAAGRNRVANDESA